MSTGAYLNKRLKALGMTDENNFMYSPVSSRITDPQQHFYHKETDQCRWPIFEALEKPCEYAKKATKAGDIRIRYFGLGGRPLTYKRNDNQHSETYYRYRIQNPEDPDRKYHQRKGSPMMPFLTQPVIDAIRKKEEIDNLILVEGEFKAQSLALLGVYAIGIPSIHGFYESNGNGKLNALLTDVIIEGKVKNIALLFDGDTISLNYAPDKDLQKRPATFYNAVVKFREAIREVLEDKETPLTNAFFVHILANQPGKGIDDLLEVLPDNKQDIVENLLQMQYARKYFRGINITEGGENNYKKLRRYFGITDSSDFYKTYGHIIGSREFVFKRRRFQYDPEEGAPRLLAHEDTAKYLRVGADWFKIIHMPNVYGILETEIKPWKVGEISRDYRRYPDFLDECPKYDNFFNAPEWHPDEYKPVVHNCYNVFRPLIHTPKEGDFPATRQFLKHLFRGEGDFDKDITGDIFTVALDYLSVSFQQPKLKLPTPILVSPERGTGKSTFLNWLNIIAAENMVVMNKENFSKGFNSHYATKFFVAIDEGYLDVEKKAEQERLKEMITAQYMWLEYKGVDTKRVPNYTRLIFCSNDADNVMKIDDGETRFFVVRIFPFEGKENPTLLEDMEAEIPAFLHYILNRPIHHPREGRLYFKPEYFITDQFMQVVKNTRPQVEKALDEWVVDTFLQYKVPDFKADLKQITERLSSYASFRIRNDQVKEYLWKKKKMKPIPTPKRTSLPIGVAFDPYNNPTVETEKKVGRCYHFFPEDWLTEEELKQHAQPFDFAEEEAQAPPEPPPQDGAGNQGPIPIGFPKDVNTIIPKDFNERNPISPF